MGVVDSHFDFLGYRFKRSRGGRLIRLVRPKSLRKLRESIKPRTRRNNGKSVEAIVADINRTLEGWFGYFKHVHPGELEEIDRWLRVRLRSILRKRRGGRGRGRGQDHHRWPNRYFTGLGPGPPHFESPSLRNLSSVAVERQARLRLPAIESFTV
jgi:RNA-directed DNA polymerase